MNGPMTGAVRGARGRDGSRGPRIGLFGLLGSGNLGNDASLEAIMTFLGSRLPGASLAFMAMGREEVEAAYGVPAVSLQWYEQHGGHRGGPVGAASKILGRLLDAPRTLAWVRRQDVVIVPGAGVLETTTPVRPWAMPWSLVLLALAARLSGTRVAYVGVGANVPGSRLIRRELGWAVRRADFRSYRDDLSRDAVERLGVDVSGDPVHPDLVFALPTEPVGTVDPRSVAVGVMNYRGGDEDRAIGDRLHDGYLDAVTHLVRTLVVEGHHVRLVVGDAEDESVVDAVVIATAAAVAAGDGSVTPIPARTPEELMDALSGVGLVVASRYHNLISALRLGIPSLSLSYAAKNDVLLAGMGLAEFCHPASAVDRDLLVRQFRELSRRRTALLEPVARRNRLNAQELAGLFDELAGFLGAPGAVPGGPADADLPRRVRSHRG